MSQSDTIQDTAAQTQRTTAGEAERVLHFADGDDDAALLEAGRVAEERQPIRGGGHDAR